MIHPTAIIHPKARVGENTKIGPYCVIGKDVKVGVNCNLKSQSENSFLKLLSNFYLDCLINNL